MQPIHKASMTDQCVARIKEDILSGVYEPEAKLPPEKDLCIQLGVSRSTLREAFRMLQALGYVRIIHGRGTFVASGTGEIITKPDQWLSTNSQELYDVMAVRLTLEQCAISRAAEKITDEEIKDMMEIQKEFISVAVEGQAVKMALYDELFHKAFINAARIPLFDQINQQITEALRNYRLNIFSVPELQLFAIAPHQKILHALASHDAAGAVQAVKEHIDHICSDIRGTVTNE